MEQVATLLYKMARGENTLKKTGATIFLVTILISACSSSISATPPDASKSAPTVTQVSTTVTATEILHTPTFTPVPVLSLPVGLQTPVPSSNTKITSENVQDLQEIARYYGEVNYVAKLTKDNKYLFILDPDGLTKYDYASMEISAYIPVANSVSDLQISNDGGLLIIDDNWLLDLKNDKEPSLHVLSEKIDLLNFYTRAFSLSPDGSVIVVAQSRCPNTCEHVFRIVSTVDWKELYITSGLTSRTLSTFSLDGKYFAVADFITMETSGGGTEPAGGTVGIWTTSDFTKVSTFDDIRFPFNVTGITFSEDNTLLAVAQRASIDIYDVASGETKATIDNLCDSYERKVLFAPAPPLRVLESSDCSSGEWTISGSTARSSADNIPDLSRIVFDEKGNFKAVPYPEPISSDIRAYYQQDHFMFLNDDILSFKRPDPETFDRYSCDLSLSSGSFDCQSKSITNSNGQFLGEDIILATDGKYYRYVVGKNKVDIYSFGNSSQVYYSIPFQYFYFSLNALDPINDIIIYTFGVGGDTNRVIIQDMTNDRILEKWEEVTFLDGIAFSENNKFVGMCRKITNVFNGPQEIDRLTIFDLSEKRIVYNANFICSGNALALSSDGEKFVSENRYLLTPTTLITRAMILNTAPPHETKYIDFASWFYPYAAVFSPDDSMLVVGCSDNEICFLDPSDGREIYRLLVHSRISNLAFSKDGTVLATSSDWGLISLWAVPPFTSNTRQTQSSPISAYTPSFSWNFDEDDNFEGWGEQDWQIGGLKDVRVTGGNLSAIATDSGTFLYSNEGLSIDASKFTQIEIRMRVSDGNSANFYFRHENDDMSEEQSTVFDIQPGVEFKTYVLDLGKIPGWKGIIYQLRLDPIHDSPGAAIDIDYIRLLP